MNIVKRILKQFFGLFPSKLPVGMAAFDAWVVDFTATYKLPTSSDTDIRFVLSTSIMHLGPTTAYKSKFYFYLLLTATASKQIASEQFRTIKERQQAEALAAKAASDVVA